MENERKKIDEIDQKIVKLLNKRTKLVKKIGEKKQKIVDKKREQQILKNITKEPQDFPVKELEKIYKIIFSTSRKIQKDLR